MYAVLGSAAVASATVQPITSHDLYGGTFDKILNIGKSADKFPCIIVIICD
jgi:hypothetical protein